MEITTRLVIFQYWLLNNLQLHYRASFKFKSECLVRLRCVSPLGNAEINNLLGCRFGVFAV